MTELENLVENSLYQTVKTLEDGKSIVMDVPTGLLYFKKSLSVYNISVFSFLKEHPDPHVAKIKAFWEDDGNLIVIEEFIQGKTLDQYLDEEEVSFEQKRRILMEVCDGLTFLHSAVPPIIHRDLKASNIMLTEDGIVKIIDYDAAKVFESEQSSDTVLMGTHGIAAPEQYGFAQSDVRTDIYALGKLIERMLPGHEEAGCIVEKATRMEPERRYSSAEQVKKQIEKLKDYTAKKKRHIPGFGSRKIWVRLVCWATVAAVVAAGAFIYYRAIYYPENKVKKPAYEAGVQFMEAGDYDAALEQFAVCGENYKDTADLIMQSEQKKTEKETDLLIDALEEALLQNDTEAMITAMTDLAGAVKYESCTEAQQERIEKLFNDRFTSYQEAKRAGDSLEFLNALLAARFGPAEHWKVLNEMTFLENNLSADKCEDALGTFDEYVKNGEPGAKERRDALLTQYLELALVSEEEFYSKGTSTELENALKIYTAVEPYKKDAAIRKNALLSKAGEILENEVAEHSYDNALYIAKHLAEYGYEDETVLANEINYAAGGYYFEEGKYSEAAKRFKQCEGYNDAADLTLECYYQNAMKQMSAGNYRSAVEAFEKCPGYSDADGKRQSAMLQYCDSKKNDPDDTAKTYLTELLSQNYPGAAELQTYMNTWRAELSIIKAFSMGSIQGVGFKAKISGPEEESTHVHFVIKILDTGERYEYTTEEAYRRGEEAGSSLTNNFGVNLFGYTYYVEAYDDSGNLMGSAQGQPE